MRVMEDLIKQEGKGHRLETVDGALTATVVVEERRAERVCGKFVESLENVGVEADRQGRYCAVPLVESFDEYALLVGDRDWTARESQRFDFDMMLRRKTRAVLRALGCQAVKDRVWTRDTPEVTLVINGSSDARFGLLRKRRVRHVAAPRRKSGRLATKGEA